MAKSLCVVILLMVSASFSPLLVASPIISTRYVVANSITDNVTGADMTGLIATETYDGPLHPLTFTSVWTATGPTSGAASASYARLTAVSISVSGSASNSLAWQYSSDLLSPLNSIELDGSAAGIYFDKAHSTPSTPGSGPGADVAFSPNLFNPDGLAGIVVTYSDPVSLKGSPPLNDLYAKLLIDFSALQPFQGLQPQDFAFTQPTDRNVATEPISPLSTLVGLAVFFCLWRVRYRMNCELASPCNHLYGNAKHLQ